MPGRAGHADGHAAPLAGGADAGHAAGGQAGNPRRFGSRRHYDVAHGGYREECRRIVRALAERYGRQPHLGAWQTNNEYACHDTVRSYSEAARAGFRDWLARRYQSTDALDRAYGNVF